MSVERDYELDDLFSEPDLLQAAYLLKTIRPPEPPLDPAFRMALRRELMQRAWTATGMRQPWWRRLAGPPALAWTGAAAAAVLIAVVAAIVYARPVGQNQTVVVGSGLDHATNVGVVQPIPVSFNQPMDHSSVESAVSIQPVTGRGEGDR